MVKPQHFTLHEVSGGVWAAESDFNGIAVGNAAIIDVGGKTIVVDTFMTDVAAAELRATAEQLTGNPVHLAVNSHWHQDHTRGNQIFSDIPIVSTRVTAERIEAESPKDLEAWREQIESMLSAAEAAAAEGDAGARLRAQHGDVYRATVDAYRLTLPNLLMEGPIEIEGERTVRIDTYGAGHTESDVFVWLPDEEILVTGDLAWNAMHPRINDGFPELWSQYASRLIDLAPKQVIPGHGPPSGPEVLEPLPSYFAALDELVEEVRSGTDPQDIEPPASGSDWADIERFRTGLSVLAQR